MRAWTRPEAIIVLATAIGAASDQVFQQCAAPALMPAQRASDKLMNLTENLISGPSTRCFKLQHRPNCSYTSGTVTCSNGPHSSVLTMRDRTYHSCRNCPTWDHTLSWQNGQRTTHKPGVFLRLLPGEVLFLHLRDDSITPPRLLRRFQRRQNVFRCNGCSRYRVMGQGPL